MFGLGTSEVIFILSVVLLFFGAKQLPDLARGLGKGVREFRDAKRDVQETIEQASIDK